MSTIPDLSTVSHADKGRQSRPYGFEEPKTGAGSTAIGTVLALSAAVFAQRVLFGSGPSQAEQVNDDPEQSISPRSPDTEIALDSDNDPDSSQTNSRLPAEPDYTSSIGQGAEPGNDEQNANPQDPTHARGSGVTPSHAAAQDDAQQHPVNDNRPRTDGPPRDEHAGGGGGGGDGSRSEGRTSAARTEAKTSGTSGGSGASNSNGNSNSGDPTQPTGGGSSGSNPGGNSSSGDTPPPNTRTNRAPVVSGPVVLNDSVMNISVAISLALLLQNASDPDGDRLFVAGLIASSGDLHDNGDGTWTFTPVSGDDSRVDFHYVVSDGQDQTAQTASLDLLPAPPPSAVDPDAFAGTPNADVITGTLQNDVIDAKAGHDIVYADAGNDIIYGGDGNDVLHGDAGDDIIFAGAGDDIVFGGDGNDIILAGEGNDVVFADAGNDIVYGGAGADVVHGGSGDDILNGGDGADRLIGDEGHDIIHGDEGDDSIVATIGDGDDEIDGGVGNDTYDLSAARHSVAVDLAAGTSVGEDTGTDSLSGIENVVGSFGNDTLKGDDGANTLSGGAGDDVLVGQAGADTLAGGIGDDTFVATLNDGDDRIDGGDGVDTYDLSATRQGVRVDLRAGLATGGEVGTDTLTGIENVVGGSGDDVFVADAHRNVFAGGDGDDTFILARTNGDDNPAHWSQIKDFSVGDRIDVSLSPFDQSEDEQNSLELEGPYGGEDTPLQSKGGKLQFSFARFDDGEHTLLVGWSHDGASEIVQVDLIGHHNLTHADFIGAH